MHLPPTVASGTWRGSRGVWLRVCPLTTATGNIFPGEGNTSRQNHFHPPPRRLERCWRASRRPLAAVGAGCAVSVSHTHTRGRLPVNCEDDCQSKNRGRRRRGRDGESKDVIRAALGFVRPFSPLSRRTAALCCPKRRVHGGLRPEQNRCIGSRAPSSPLPPPDCPGKLATPPDATPVSWTRLLPYLTMLCPTIRSGHLEQTHNSHFVSRRRRRWTSHCCHASPGLPRISGGRARWTGHPHHHRVGDTNLTGPGSRGRADREGVVGRK